MIDRKSVGPGQASGRGILVAGLLMLAACGGDDSSPSTESVASAESDTSTTSSSGAVGDKQDVVGAVVRIVASGSYRDISEGTMTADWSGTGFIISSDGLIVTNQHVVEGAGSLEVYVKGEERPKNARILGVSECNDLAVIDLEGDGYPYLDWYTGDVEPGLDVWVAGFPLGDPEYTLTRGSITKAEANGNTEWASLDYTLEHDARQEPGNSGGPLVTETGQVVGINYAGGDIGGTGVEHFYSIPVALAEPIVETLKSGEDQDSIGVNGTAFYDDSSGLAGLWVSGVRAGSPASAVGLQPGDVITDLAGRPIVTAADFERDGAATKAGYCDVIRTQGSERAISISVVRFDTGEILSGEVNNPDKPLTLQQSIAGDITGNSSTDSDFTYDLVSDDTGQVEVEVPREWSERDGSQITFLDGKWPSVAAAPDLDGLYNRWDTPGIIVAAAPGLNDSDIANVLTFFQPADCSWDSSNDYSTSTMVGSFDLYYDCGGSGGATYVVGAFYDNYYEAIIIVAATGLVDADFTAIDHALETVYLP